MCSKCSLEQGSASQDRSICLVNTSLMLKARCMYPRRWLRTLQIQRHQAEKRQATSKTSVSPSLSVSLSDCPSLYLSPSFLRFFLGFLSFFFLFAYTHAHNQCTNAKPTCTLQSTLSSLSFHVTPLSLLPSTVRTTSQQTPHATGTVNREFNRERHRATHFGGK